MDSLFNIFKRHFPLKSEHTRPTTSKSSVMDSRLYVPLQVIAVMSYIQCKMVHKNLSTSIVPDGSINMNETVSMYVSGTDMHLTGQL